MSITIHYSAPCSFYLLLLGSSLNKTTISSSRFDSFDLSSLSTVFLRLSISSELLSCIESKCDNTLIILSYQNLFTMLQKLPAKYGTENERHPDRLISSNHRTFSARVKSVTE